MAREHRKDHHSSHRYEDHYKLSRPQKSCRSPSPPQYQKIHKFKDSRNDATVISQPQYIMLDEAGMNELAAKIKDLSTQTGGLQFTKGLSSVRVTERPQIGKDVVKPTKFVSIGGIFRNHKRSTKEVKKDKEKVPDPKVLTQFTNGIETVYTSIKDATYADFDAIHHKFEQHIEAARQEDVQFLESISTATNRLSAPLTDEAMEIQSRKNGKLIKETIKMGDRVAQFKADIERESRKLEVLWTEWEQLQHEYLDLGVEVFGARAMGERESSGSLYRARGFKNEMDELDGEYVAGVEEIEGEIVQMREKSLKSLRTTEREIERAAKKELEDFLRLSFFG